MEHLNLRELIRKSPYRTQERFAAASGIAEPTISKYCRGIRELKMDHLTTILQLLEIDKKLLTDRPRCISHQERASNGENHA